MTGENHSKADEAAENNTATTRLNQLSDQIKPKTRRKKTKAQVGPADWSDILSEFDHVRQLAQTPKSNTTGYKRHKEAGKLWVRERVELLLDKGTFREVGSTAGTATWRKVDPEATNIAESEREVVDDFTPSNNVQGMQYLLFIISLIMSGFGKINGRKVMLTADDFTLRAGHADGSLMMKTLYFEQLAIHLKIPMIKLVDGSSGQTTDSLFDSS